MPSLSLTSCYFGELNWNMKPVLNSPVPWYRTCLQVSSQTLNTYITLSNDSFLFDSTSSSENVTDQCMNIQQLLFHMQKLALEINNTQETMDAELLEVVTVCNKLSYLKVRVFLKISFLERLLQKGLDRKCALNTIKVCVL